MQGPYHLCYAIITLDRLPPLTRTRKLWSSHRRSLLGQPHPVHFILFPDWSAPNSFLPLPHIFTAVLPGPHSQHSFSSSSPQVLYSQMDITVNIMHNRTKQCHFVFDCSFQRVQSGTVGFYRYDFLLVINCTWDRILHHFRDIAFDMSKFVIFGYSSCILPLLEAFPWDPGMIFVKFCTVVNGWLRYKTA